MIRANPHLLRVKPYVPGKPIEEVRREFGLKSVIKLASNENPFGPSPKVLKAIAAAARHVNRYPDGGCFALRQEIAGRLAVMPQQLVFGCGSDEIIVLALRALVVEGDEVVMAKPSFLVYAIASTVVGARLVEVPLKGLQYDLKAMRAAVTPRTRIVFIGHPDNPSGQFPPKSDVLDFMRGLPEDVVVFFDEAYFEFVDDRNYTDTLALLRKRKNIIVARTFSKLYGLAGLRVGYGVMHPEMADLMDRVREPFNVTSVAQAAALAALRDKGYYARVLKIINHERAGLCAGLAGMGLAFDSGATNFIQVFLPYASGAVTLGLMKKGVIVRDMSVWGLQDYIRVTIGAPAENKRFLKALKEVLACMAQQGRKTRG